MNRRDFVKTSCKTCILTGSGLLITSFLESCSSLKVYQSTLINQVIEVPLSVFEPEESRKIIRVSGLDYDILLSKIPGKEPVAYLLKCTHIDNRINVTNSGFTCNFHGSRFAADGTVIQGPAIAPLTRYRVKQNPDALQIQLT